MSETQLEQLEVQLLEQKIRLTEAEAVKQERENRYYKAQPLAHGRFQLLGAVTEHTVTTLIDKMSTWSTIHPDEPITLTINSPGGGVIDGYALYDFLLDLKTRGHEITTFGLGMQASMGGIILQAGDSRVMSPRSWMLIHELQGYSVGSFSERDDDMKFTARLQDQALDILAARAKISKRTIKTRWKRKDWWLSADDALKEGFIDRIEGV